MIEIHLYVVVFPYRRKFGAQGWNRNYPFNNGDLTISVNVLYNYLEANSKVPCMTVLFTKKNKQIKNEFVIFQGRIFDIFLVRLCMVVI